MNETAKKVGSHTAVAILAAGIASLSPHNVKYELPKDSVVMVRDANGTDGSDPTKVDVLVKVPKGDGTFRVERVRKGKLAGEK